MDNRNYDSASELVRLTLLVETVAHKAKEQHPELSENDLDRAIRFLTLDRLDRIARNLEKR